MFVDSSNTPFCLVDDLVSVFENCFLNSMIQTVKILKHRFYVFSISRLCI